MINIGISIFKAAEEEYIIVSFFSRKQIDHHIRN